MYSVDERYIPNALATATSSRMEMRGMTNTATPILDTMSAKSAETYFTISYRWNDRERTMPPKTYALFIDSI